MSKADRFHIEAGRIVYEPTTPNPLTPSERKELELLQKNISEHGRSTELEILLRFAELRKKHADYFFRQQLERAEVKVKQWEQQVKST